MEYKDYYKTLGINKTAGQDEIKKAYRKLAAKYHPDVNQDDKTAAQKFKEVSEAYEVLKNPDDRKMYDQMGADWKKYKRSGGSSQDFNWQQWSRQRGANQSQQRTYTYQGGPGFEEQFGGESPFSDFFESFFGGGGRDFGARPGASQRRAPVKGRDLKAELDITMEDVYNGTEKSIVINRQRIKIKIPKGIENGKRLKLSGKGEAPPGGGKKGDLYIRLNIKEHPDFRREGDNLYYDLETDLYTAVLGGTADIPAFGEKVKIKIPPEAQQGMMLRLSGRGLPQFENSARRGNLYVKINIQLPENLTKKEKELFQELAKLRKQVQ